MSHSVSHKIALSLGERTAIPQSRESRVRGYCVELTPRRRASNPSPVPRRLMETPDAVHHLPKGEGYASCFAFLRWAGLALCGLLLFGCRQDMHVQPKYVPLDASDFFDDGRSARPEVPGTVAHGHLRANELLYTGKLNGEPSDAFPFPITRAVLECGRERYNIYCSPCHDYTGSGNGLVVQRGFPPPPSYHIERLMKAPAGHFFDVMTNGFGMMYSYASRVTPEDRWAIVAYIRALQLSQHAALEDVAPKERQPLTEQAK